MYLYYSISTTWKTYLNSVHKAVHFHRVALLMFDFVIERETVIHKP